MGIEIKTHEEYMGRIPMDKSGRFVRLIIKDTPKNKVKIEGARGKADFFAYNSKTKSMDFTFNKDNPFIISAIAESEREDYCKEGLEDFFLKNQKALIDHGELMLKNNLYGSMIHSQIISNYKSYGPKGLAYVYVDDRVPFKGRNEYVRIRNRLVEDNLNIIQ